jgi:hypothetical protein
MLNLLAVVCPCVYSFNINKKPMCAVLQMFQSVWYDYKELSVNKLYYLMIDFVHNFQFCPVSMFVIVHMLSDILYIICSYFCAVYTKFHLPGSNGSWLPHC